CAYMLSRLSSQDQTSSEPALADDNEEIIIASLGFNSTSQMEEIVKATKSDPLFKKIKKHMVNSWPPKESLSGDIWVFFQHCQELSVQGDCLFLGERLIIPAKRQQSMLELLHSGHPGRI
ncbi:MAG: hypothetical protein GY799_31850, partial [Desulfobulbaceae bacterium]|nr:hypothetical protein [Desulfobulbaceae bacterium]